MLKPVLNWFEAHSGAFAALGLLTVALIMARLYFSGRKAEAPFRAEADEAVRFRERGASGHSKRSVITRLAGSTRALEIVVTTRELWIKGIWPMYTYIGSQYDLTHKVPLSRIRRVAASGKKVEVWFADASGSECHVELVLEDTEGFLAAVAPRGGVARCANV